jgi:hypothetical protein
MMFGERNEPSSRQCGVGRVVQTVLLEQCSLSLRQTALDVLQANCQRELARILGELEESTRDRLSTFRQQGNTVRVP